MPEMVMVLGGLPVNTRSARRACKRFGIPEPPWGLLPIPPGMTVVRCELHHGPMYLPPEAAPVLRHAKATGHSVVLLCFICVKHLRDSHNDEIGLVSPEVGLMAAANNNHPLYGWFTGQLS